LAADVASYSRLMHNDEEATHAKLTALLTDAVAPAIAEHGGRIVKNTGDGFLGACSNWVLYGSQLRRSRGSRAFRQVVIIPHS
jgi:class 3 adenylate cyclase